MIDEGDISCEIAPRWMSLDLTDDVNIDSANGLVPSGTKPLSEPMLTVLCCHMVSLSLNKYRNCCTNHRRVNSGLADYNVSVSPGQAPCGMPPSSMKLTGSEICNRAWPDIIFIFFSALIKLTSYSWDWGKNDDLMWLDNIYFRY